MHENEKRTEVIRDWFLWWVFGSAVLVLLLLVPDCLDVDYFVSYYVSYLVTSLAGHLGFYA